MKIQLFSKIKYGRQDGAIFGGYLFSFNHKGACSVYEIAYLSQLKDEEAEAFSEFVLDKNDLIVPHSNSVAFGSEYYDDEDEFPLLYTNIYNNYTELKGVTLVYRLQRDGKKFTSTLVQMIEIGFVENENLWKSENDVRPYGNCAIDRENGIYYAFVMRNGAQSTRYFAFDLPKVTCGELHEKYGVKRVVLEETDIKEYFDCDFHRYVQGACLKDGKIYSLEGFTDRPDAPPVIRIIDTIKKEQIFYKEFKDLGTNIEPELIDFDGENCYYSDHFGNLYKILWS